MSDLLIKNLDIPKSFQRLRLTILPDGSVCRIEPFNEAVLPTEAKAEILEEHGDLIDRDILARALVAETEMVVNSAIAPSVKPDVLYELKNVGNMIFEQDVVLPKSGS